jgi:hypothetical protein
MWDALFTFLPNCWAQLSVKLHFIALNVLEFLGFFGCLRSHSDLECYAFFLLRLYPSSK